MTWDARRESGEDRLTEAEKKRLQEGGHSHMWLPTGEVRIVPCHGTLWWESLENGWDSSQKEMGWRVAKEAKTHKNTVETLSTDNSQSQEEVK